MSPYFFTHTGMLQCVARDFVQLGRGGGPEARRFALYAQLLERMIAELAQTHADPLSVTNDETTRVQPS